MIDLRIATYNVGSVGKDQFKDDLQRVREASDIICLQEVADREDLLNPNEHWGLFQPTGHNKDHNAITWRKGPLDHKENSTEMLTESKSCGPTGAGGDPLGAVWLHCVKLYHNKTNRTINVLATHMVPSVQGDAANQQGKECRQGLFKKAIAGIVNRTKVIEKGCIFVGADWNAVPDFNLMNPLTGPLILGYTPKNTHGSRAIDMVYHVKNSNVIFKSQAFVDGVNSDHKAVVITFNIKPKE
jgi:exonuclease III